MKMLLRIHRKDRLNSLYLSLMSTSKLNGICCSVHQDLKEAPQNEPIYNRHCFEAPVATTCFGSTHHCDDLLPFALPLSACQSILPIKPTDNSLASPLNTQAAPGRRSIMDTSPQDQPPWPYTGTSQTTTINKRLFILVLCFGGHCLLSAVGCPGGLKLTALK